MVLQHRAAPGEVHCLGILDEECAVRVAHAGRHRIALDRQVQRVDLARQRNGPPLGVGLPHVDPSHAVACILAGQKPALGPDRQGALPRVVHQVPRDAARCVSAGGRKRAVGVVEHQPHRGFRVGMHHGELIEAHAPVPVAKRARHVLGHRRPALAEVDHDEVVAKPVHLHEGPAGVGASGHGARYRGFVGLWEA